MRLSKFFRHWRLARQRVQEEISGNRSGGMHARGMSMEGYAGGYMQALDDIDAVLRDVPPGDPRGYWRGLDTP